MSGDFINILFIVEKKLNIVVKFLFRSSICIFFFLICGVAQANTPDRILVVYNSNWTGDNDNDGMQDSLQIANYYVTRRSVPANNMLGVACSTGTLYYYSSTKYADFYDEMVMPIKNKLTELGPTKIDIILLCYGVPITVPGTSGGYVSIDNALIGINYLAESNNITWYTNPHQDSHRYGHWDRPEHHHSVRQYRQSLYKSHGYRKYSVPRIVPDRSGS